MHHVPGVDTLARCYAPHALRHVGIDHPPAVEGRFLGAVSHRAPSAANACLNAGAAQRETATGKLRIRDRMPSISRASVMVGCVPPRP
jgi:hypothetical protein